jgi:hypothetical protein
VVRTSRPNSTRERAVVVGKPSTWILGLPDRVEWDGPEEDVEKAKGEIKSQESADSEVEDFYWTKRHSFAKGAQEGDLVISIYRPDYNNRAAKQIRVYKPAWIRRIIPAGNKPDMGFVIVSPKSDGAETLGWLQFQTMAEAAGIKRLSPDCGILITDRQRRMLDAQWQTPKRRLR